jgi:hypothetical protein
MLGPEQRVACGLFAFTAVWCLGVALLGSTQVLLFLAPVLLLALPLAFGRYLGETQLAQLRERRRQASTRRSTPEPAPASRRPFAILPRGGRLIATALATRPPPLSLQQP